MKRDPSIHITESQLVKVLDYLKANELYVINKNDVMAKNIMEASKKFCVINRNIEITNAHLERKTKRVLSSNMFSAMTFSNLLLYCRKQAKHRGVQQIKAGSKDWELLKEITGQAVEFVKTYDLPVKEGFTHYIKIGMAKMTKFSLPKLLSMSQAIFESYEAAKDIEEDDNPNGTMGLFNYYQKIIALRTGMSTQYERIPDKFIYFIKARKIADEHSISYKDYIDAQFEGLEFTGGVPDPIQLVGDKAMERLNKFMYKKNKDRPNEEKKMNWSNILNNGKDND